MLRIIINSYTCCPNMGSEPGMGWNWIINLARYCEVYVISEGEYREQCEDGAKGLPIHWYWNPIGGNDRGECERIRKMCWNQGDWRFYRYYERWQRKTADIARDICGKNKIDILHQLNMIGFREPGYLWQVSKESGIPFVWGPVDAKGAFPMKYVEGAPLKNRIFLSVKNIITELQLRYGCRVRKSVKQASLILAANSNSVRSIKRYFDVNCVLMNETGCDSIVSNKQFTKSKIESNELSLLWVGKLDFRKQLSIAIRTIAELKEKKITLHVLGSGDSDVYKELALKLGISAKIIWHGLVAHSEVQRLMYESDALFFTSVAEGTPHSVLEAISNGLPVICFDTCGQGDVVDSSVGIKIPLTTPSGSVKTFAEKIEYLYNNRDELVRMSENCIMCAEKNYWDKKAQHVVSLYDNLLAKSHE